MLRNKFFSVRIKVSFQLDNSVIVNNFTSIACHEKIIIEVVTLISEEVKFTITSMYSARKYDNKVSGI